MDICEKINMSPSWIQSNTTTTTTAAPKLNTTKYLLLCGAVGGFSRFIKLLRLIRHHIS